MCYAYGIIVVQKIVVNNSLTMSVSMSIKRKENGGFPLFQIPK